MSVIDLRELSGKVGAHVPGGPSEAEPGGVHAVRRRAAAALDLNPELFGNADRPRSKTTTALRAE